MKKQILIIALFMVSVASFGQVGIGTTNPLTTLQVDASTVVGDADGVLVPRVTVDDLNTKSAAYGPNQNGSLVFVTAIANAAGKTSEVTATGFYYYNNGTSKWTAVGGGGVDTSLYSGNGQLTGARTVDQNNNNLTFTTGTARAIVDGSFQTAGAVYAKVRRHVDATNIVWTSTDYAVIITNAGITNVLALPNASANANRILIINNATPGGVNFIATVGENRPVTTASLTGGRTGIFISDGENWYALGK